MLLLNYEASHLPGEKPQYYYKIIKIQRFQKFIRKMKFYCCSSRTFWAVFLLLFRFLALVSIGLFLPFVRNSTKKKFWFAFVVAKRNVNYQVLQEFFVSKNFSSWKISERNRSEPIGMWRLLYWFVKNFWVICTLRSHFHCCFRNFHERVESFCQFCLRIWKLHVLKNLSIHSSKLSTNYSTSVYYVSMTVNAYVCQSYCVLLPFLFQFSISTTNSLTFPICGRRHSFSEKKFQLFERYLSKHLNTFKFIVSNHFLSESTVMK